MPAQVATEPERKKVGRYRQIMREVAAEAKQGQAMVHMKPVKNPVKKLEVKTPKRPHPIRKLKRKMLRPLGGTKPFSPMRLFRVARDTSKAVATYQKQGGHGAPQPELNDFTPTEHYAMTGVLWVQDIQQAEWERNGEWTLDAGSDNPDRLERFRTWQEGLDEACTWSEDKQTGDVVMRFRARDGGGVNIFQTDSTPAPVRLAAWERERRQMLALDARHKPGNGQLQQQRKAWEKTQP